MPWRPCFVMEGGGDYCDQGYKRNKVAPSGGWSSPHLLTKLRSSEDCCLAYCNVLVTLHVVPSVLEILNWWCQRHSVYLVVLLGYATSFSRVWGGDRDRYGFMCWEGGGAKSKVQTVRVQRYRSSWLGLPVHAKKRSIEHAFQSSLVL